MILDDVEQLIGLFNQTFVSFNTILVEGDEEPIYLPADQRFSQHRVVFAHGFYASALHEIAHWCIAGNARRQLEDYGYWYHPDGRDQSLQQKFERVEVKPQAIECAFSKVAGRTFQVSVDNLSGYQSDRQAFSQAVQQQFLDFQKQGFPSRAQQFIEALAKLRASLSG